MVWTQKIYLPRFFEIEIFKYGYDDLKNYGNHALAVKVKLDGAPKYDYVILFFSYETPIALYDNREYVLYIDSGFISKTTERHKKMVLEFVSGIVYGGPDIKETPYTHIERLFREKISERVAERIASYL